MNHVACWLWYYETCEEFDQQICQDPRRPSPTIQVMVPPHLRIHLDSWRASERRLVSLNSKLRWQILPLEVRVDRQAMREALDLHETMSRLPEAERLRERALLMPGYDSVAPELEECVHPTSQTAAVATFIRTDP